MVKIDETASLKRLLSFVFMIQFRPCIWSVWFTFLGDVIGGKSLAPALRKLLIGCPRDPHFGNHPSMLFLLIYQLLWQT